MKTMEQHNTGNFHIDILLLTVSGMFGMFGELSFDESAKATYYVIGTVSLLIVIAKNIWEWREKIKAKQNGK